MVDVRDKNEEAVEFAVLLRDRSANTDVLLPYGPRSRLSGEGRSPCVEECEDEGAKYSSISPESVEDCLEREIVGRAAPLLNRNMAGVLTQVVDGQSEDERDAQIEPSRKVIWWCKCSG